MGSTELGEFYRNTELVFLNLVTVIGTYDVGVGKTSVIRNDIAEKKALDDPNINTNRSVSIEETYIIT